MSRAGYFICFVSLGFFSLLIAQLIRARLKTHHQELYAKLGHPSSQDSNLEPKHWTFQKFVLWGHIAEVTDPILHGLCVLASITALGVLVLFFLSI